MPTPTTPTTTDNEPSPPRATADKFVSSTALCERFGLARKAMPRFQALHHDHRGRQRGALRLSAESRTR